MQTILQSAYKSTDHFSGGPHEFKKTLTQFHKKGGHRRWCEVGGGRRPLFSQEEIKKLGIEYTVNDISQSELDITSDDYKKACFDISQGGFADESFDLIFSRMLFEHIKDARKAYANVYRLLSPGGLVINFHPVLYAFPFFVNSLLPEDIGRKILVALDPERKDKRPKFPAHYSLCRATRGTEDAIRALGFREVQIVPFYGHSYYGRYPLLHKIHEAITKFVREKDLRFFASYAYTIAIK